MLSCPGCILSLLYAWYVVTNCPSMGLWHYIYILPSLVSFPAMKSSRALVIKMCLLQQKSWKKEHECMGMTAQTHSSQPCTICKTQRTRYIQHVRVIWYVCNEKNKLEYQYIYSSAFNKVKKKKTANKPIILAVTQTKNMWITYIIKVNIDDGPSLDSEMCIS